VTEWVRYYDATGDEPRETLLAAMEGFATPGVAVDLGCGAGEIPSSCYDAAGG
jgi:16S rRNA G1207 methylase RsmC